MFSFGPTILGLGRGCPIVAEESVDVEAGGAGAAGAAVELDADRLAGGAPPASVEGAAGAGAATDAGGFARDESSDGSRERLGWNRT